MPIVDMSLDELRVYQGTNPRPDDFDEYWDRALIEMKATDRQVELVESSFSSPVARFYDLYFTGVGGARVHASFAKPKNIKGKCPAILNFHGYRSSCLRWMDLLPYAASGFAVASLDCRGQAGKSEDIGGNTGNTMIGHIIRGLNDDPDKLLYRSIFLDTAELAGIIMDMDDVNENRVGACGASQGGGLTIACSALEPRIKRAVFWYPFLSDYKRVWEMDLTLNAYA